MSPIGRILPFLCVVIINLNCHASTAQNMIYTYCPNTTFFPATNTALRSSLNTLLSNLSAATYRSSPTPGFYNSTAGTFYGNYLCRGDDDPATCRDCVAAAAATLTQSCPRGKQAVTWYNACMVRYSNVSFFGQKDSSFSWRIWNLQNITNNVTGFNHVLQTTLQKIATKAAEGDATLKFDTEEAKFNDFQTVYALGQCTPDLSQSDCYNCLQQSISKMPTGNKQGARILYFSCNLYYDIYKFYTTRTATPPPSPAPSDSVTPPLNSGGNSSPSKAVIGVISGAAAVGLVLLAVIFCLFKRKKKNKYVEAAITCNIP